MMGMFHICPVHYGSHWPRVGTKHSKCDWRDEETASIILFNFSEFKFK